MTYTAPRPLAAKPVTAEPLLPNYYTPRPGSRWRPRELTKLPRPFFQARREGVKAYLQSTFTLAGPQVGEMLCQGGWVDRVHTVNPRVNPGGFNPR